MRKTRINIAIVLAVLLAGINHRAIAEKIQGWWDFAEQSSLTNPASGYRRLAFSIDGTQRATFCASGCDTTVTTMNGYANMGFLLFGFESGASYTMSYADWFYFAYASL